MSGVSPEALDGARAVLARGRRGRLLPDEEVALSIVLQEAQEAEDVPPDVAAVVQAARERFVEGNMGLVVSIARRYVQPGISLDDLVQEGTIGLLRAIDLYDGRRGFRFSTYATWWIRQAIAQALTRTRRDVVLPRGIAAELARVEVQRRELEQALGRQPSMAELAAASGIDELRVRELQGYARSVLSLDQAVGEERDVTLADIVPDRDAEPIEETIEHADLRTVIAGALAHLEPREREVLAFRFGLEGNEPHSLEDAAAYFGIARERIRQIEARAIARLRRGDLAPVLRRVLED
ncbi:RNA polymerase, sigma 32 subunit, RpoH [Acidimicrobium ferrooxidans DSM 10331]|uniref:RNA polymerase, sigma 32 subunit, RpoH n=1 Tax=Acidimicrobium ferrooxidans (strain DSM 10331 / JCM 15462 / NBRC 103882 / ICP) TaxID=525909 RepID=C7LZN3_ACIFD|nr:sigma-70 family RNA polymerase sigma factor [Acidimicrobium ferrooxidans]ACU54191.1 RNA polymerase, sigma 32 subunit, RpoH [Acidimicrobium ferrooxidans DSM 10331]